jgi:hypothetical protein
MAYPSLLPLRLGIDTSLTPTSEVPFNLIQEF